MGLICDLNELKFKYDSEIVDTYIENNKIPVLENNTAVFKKKQIDDLECLVLKKCEEENHVLNEESKESYYSSDIIGQYLEEISKYGVLNKEEIKNLFIKYNNGDEIAEKKIIKHNLKLVVNYAKRYSKKDELLDLIQEGNLGLFEAVKRFDYKKEYEFSTYAIWWIRQKITRYIHNHGRNIRIPIHTIETYNKICKLENEANKNNVKVTYKKISEVLGIPIKKIKIIKSYFNKPRSLEEKIGEGESFLYEFIKDTKAIDPLQHTAYKNLKENIIKYSQGLKEKEKFVLFKRLGLDENLDFVNKPWTLKNIGDKLNMTRENVRLIFKKITYKITHPSIDFNLFEGID